MNKSELLTKIPEVIRPQVTRYIDLVLGLTSEEITKMSDYLLGGDQQAAYEVAVSKMTGAELYQAMQDTNAKQKAATGRVLTQKATQKAILMDIVNTLLQVGIAAIAK
jgi:hypothetical protein